jgi:hypothetical protein
MEIQTKGQEMKTTKEIKAWLTSLEMERTDKSYLKPKEVGLTEYTKIVYRDKVVDHRFRDNIMFQAGRYQEGARDLEALNGHKVASNLISKEGKK